MKKILSAILVLAMLLSMTACGVKVPDGMTKETYSLGKDALKIMDQYLEEKIDLSTASDKLMEISDALDAESDVLEEEKESGSLDVLEYIMTNGFVSFYISSFALGMFGDGYDCQEMRDSLAGVLKIE